LRIGNATGDVVFGTIRGPAIIPGIPNDIPVPDATLVPSFPRTLIVESVISKVAEILTQGSKLFVLRRQPNPWPDDNLRNRARRTRSVRS
jgi:hypothetical protein